MKTRARVTVGNLLGVKLTFNDPRHQMRAVLTSYDPKQIIEYRAQETPFS